MRSNLFRIIDVHSIFKPTEKWGKGNLGTEDNLDEFTRENSVRTT